MEPLKLIKVDSKGAHVENWQYFLTGIGFYKDLIDSDFGPATLAATIKFQRSAKLQPDGIVGNKSYGAALLLNFQGV